MLKDRLYGRIELPDVAEKLAMTCPVILRLREIRMANIPFLTHPSFANVDRYEHSVGVAHLAWRWAQKNGLPTDLGTALTIAALYHDGSTPAYGHLFEEVLKRSGFDHEKKLVQLLEGQPEYMPGREHVQIFLGQQCKLRTVLPRPKDESSPLTPLRIANLAAGGGALGSLIKGEIDLDNIDNVIRASSAMGLVRGHDMIHPYAVSDSIVLEDGELRIRSDSSFAIAAWAKTRRLLYDSILNNAYEFRAQATIKWAIEECAREDESLLAERAWCLTDSELVFERLRRHPFARKLVDRVRIGKPPDILFSAWIDDLSPLLGKDGARVSATICQEISELTNKAVYLNYYVDKRERVTQIPRSRESSLLNWPPSNTGPSCTAPKQTPRGIIGIISLPRFERSTESSTDVTSLAARPIELSCILKILQRTFGEEPKQYTSGWVGTRGEPQQFQLSMMVGE
jgi:HD superfamily phosphohydrolase